MAIAGPDQTAARSFFFFSRSDARRKSAHHRPSWLSLMHCTHPAACRPRDSGFAQLIATSPRHSSTMMEDFFPLSFAATSRRWLPFFFSFDCWGKDFNNIPGRLRRGPRFLPSRPLVDCRGFVHMYEYIVTKCHAWKNFTAFAGCATTGISAFGVLSGAMLCHQRAPPCSYVV